MISICLLTRKRPEYFMKMCKSILDNAHDPNNIEFVSYHDTDDKSKYEYIGNHKEVVMKRNPFLAQCMNECQKIATGPIYMFIADDFTIDTKDWDLRVQEEFDKYPDKIVLVCPDNNTWRIWKYGTCGFLHKNWIDTVGYMFPPMDGGQSSDRWVWDVAGKINRRVKLDSVMTTHFNHRDAVHRTKNRLGWDNQWTLKYNLDQSNKLRMRDVSLLANFILNYEEKDIIKI